MRKTLTAIAVILLFATVSSAPAGDEGPGLLITPDQIHLGTIDEGPPAVATVTVENVSDAVVTATNIRTN
jgi:hypothetical protein